ncbi:hypothetical protein SAMN05518684_108172 [Salipaludibacillus aurantiacus]|uniref:Uncharacterized protein n=1 Tax=Salipaludibacillus aurantiacus TaxID=1601833 RepID=A0A1H9UTT3_9BACI|nr:hypothetical protein SAMN05518684_108172 [Salipaludibacillus aurantiacus]
MPFNKVIGIGWDVGGWMGKNHGAAICEWVRQIKFTGEDNPLKCRSLITS